MKLLAVNHNIVTDEPSSSANSSELNQKRKILEGLRIILEKVNYK